VIDRREFLRRGGLAALGVTAVAATGSGAAVASSLGLTSHRFSIAWSRVQPGGTGPGNVTALEHYSRLIDSWLDAGLRPMPTLFDGDLPPALLEAGGWSERDTACRYADYARIVADALGDRIESWILLDDPPGFLLADTEERNGFLRASHVANLAVGRGFRAIKAARPDARVGTAVRLAPCEAATASAEDAAAAERFHRFRNAWFLDPILRGTYPNAFLDKIPYDLMRVRDGDLETARAPLAFVGLDVFSGMVVSYEPDDTSRIGLAYTASGGRAYRHHPTVGDRKRTMHGARSRLARDYGCAVVEITRSDGRYDTDRPMIGGLKGWHARLAAAGVLQT
jgi:beta-glucosidase